MADRVSPTTEYVTIIVEISKVCGGIGLSLAAHNSLCTGHILAWGSEAQKQKYLPALASGEALGAWGLTEAGTGSDAGNMRCTAVMEGGQWVLNGTKNWITHGISGDIAVVNCPDRGTADPQQCHRLWSSKEARRDLVAGKRRTS